MGELTLQHEWVPAQNAPGRPYLFPGDLSPYFREHYRRPCIYRWNVFKSQPEDSRKAYVGETELLDRRVYHYLHPGPRQQTNLRLKALFDMELSKGNSIALEIFGFETFCLNGVSISVADLRDKVVRRLMEGIASIALHQQGFELLNL